MSDESILLDFQEKFKNIENQMENNRYFLEQDFLK
jgi:hypothetical protein